MESKASAAVDIIYTLPEKLDSLLSKIAALEARSTMLELKLNTIISNASSFSAHAQQSERLPPAVSDDPAPSKDDASEIMEIRSKAPKKAAEPFNFGKPLATNQGEEPVIISAPPLSIEASKEENTGVRIPVRPVDPMPQSAVQAEPVHEKQTSILIRGRLREREGGSIAAVDVKIFDDKNVMVKKTKTAATGEWIAMLPAGEYTVEFTKPGQKPLFKPISVISGKKEIEVLI